MAVDWYQFVFYFVGSELREERWFHVVVFDFPDLEVGGVFVLVVGDVLAAFWHPARFELFPRALCFLEVVDLSRFQVV